MEYTNSTSVIYEDNYNKYILPKYGSPRNVEYDLDLITSNNLEINDVKMNYYYKIFEKIIDKLQFNKYLDKSIDNYLNIQIHNLPDLHKALNKLSDSYLYLYNSLVNKTNIIYLSDLNIDIDVNLNDFIIISK